MIKVYCFFQADHPALRFPTISDKITFMLTLGVIADTHIPGRVRRLPPTALEVFTQAKVAAILHAGDISAMRVLDQLGEIAPVYAIRGNADLLLVGRLPWVRRLEFESVSIGMSHGHGAWRNYIPDRIHYIFHGPKKFSYYENLARQQVPDVRVVVLGHNHVPVNYWIEGQLIFNPGSPSLPNRNVPGLKPSVGLLHIDQHNVRGEIVFI